MSAQATRHIEDQVLWISCVTPSTTVAGCSASEGSEPLPCLTNHFRIAYQPLWSLLLHRGPSFGDVTTANPHALLLLPQLAMRGIRDFCSTIIPRYSASGVDNRWIVLHTCDVATLVMELDKLWFRKANLQTSEEGYGEGSEAGFFGLRGEVVLGFGAYKNVEDSEGWNEGRGVSRGMPNQVALSSPISSSAASSGTIYISVIHSSPITTLASPASTTGTVGQYHKTIHLPLTQPWTRELLDGIVRSAVVEMGMWRVDKIRIIHSGQRLEDKTLLLGLWESMVKSGGGLGVGKGVVFEAIVSATWAG
ncbi:hypothetical protein BGX38DRAFT_1242179 [Terfezia claveryi]|nr:hypothetical protein BGX38DRAFT_1242179 [Terfezia claveryi]